MPPDLPNTPTGPPGLPRGPAVQPCAGGIVLDAAGRLLVIQRGREPGLGLWSIPGGRCESGEPAVDACVREVAEETGLTVRVQRWAGRVERSAPDGRVYVIDDYVCVPVAGTLRAGDDALDAVWVDRLALLELPLVDGLVPSLEAWDAMPD